MRVPSEIRVTKFRLSGLLRAVATDFFGFVINSGITVVFGCLNYLAQIGFQRMTNPVKTGLHHWWPKGLSSFWSNDEDCVVRITPEGGELRSPPAQFGGITNGHAVKLDGPWSFSFESKFDAIDSRLPYLVDDLLKFDAKHSYTGLSFEERFQSQFVTDEFLQDLGSTLASMIIRSPSHRNSIAKTTEYYQKRLGFEQPSVDKNLINMNLASKLDTVLRNFIGGKYIVAYSDEAEFIFGDGFYTNMAGEHPLGHLKTVLPITPVMCVIYSRPKRYFTEPKLMTIRLAKTEVLQFNELVQVYSKDQLFYRSQKPDLLDSFTCGKFLKFRHNKVAWLDTFLDAAHGYRTLPI